MMSKTDKADIIAYFVMIAGTFGILLSASRLYILFEEFQTLIVITSIVFVFIFMALIIYTYVWFIRYKLEK
jgi:hypothetical protein